MSYLSIQGLSINKKALTVSGKSSSSNVWGWDNKKVWNSFKESFDTTESLENFLVGLANDILSGSVRLAKSHIFNKRIAYLRQEGLLEEKGSDYVKWEAVTPTPVVKSILTGETPINLKVFSVSGDLYGVRVTTRHFSLVGRPKSTIFYDRSEAESVLSKIDNWRDLYNLSVTEKSITK